MILIATFRKDDMPNGELLRLFWEPRTGIVWLFRSFPAPGFPTLYYAKRRFAVDVMVADVWGGRYPKTFRAIPRRDRPTADPRFRANSVSPPVGRDENAQPRERRKRDEV